MVAATSSFGVFPGFAKRRQRSLEAGFTMVEVMVTIAIIGILAAFAIPSFKGMMPRFQLGNATQRIANEIAMSRMSAIAKSTEFAIKFNVADNSYSLYQYTDDPSTSAVDYNWRKNTTTTLGASLDIDDVQGMTYKTGGSVSPATIQFNASGTTSVPISKEAVYIMLQTKPDGAARRRIVVMHSGSISTEKWAGSSWKKD